MPKDASYTTRSARGVRPVRLLTLRAAAQDRGCLPTRGPQGQAEEQGERREQSWDSRPASGGRGGEADVLAHVALGGGVEGRELHVAGVLVPHLVKHFLKGVEPTVGRVHIVLIYLQGEHGRAVSSPGRPGQTQAVAESSQGSTPERGAQARREPTCRSEVGHKVQPSTNHPAQLPSLFPQISHEVPEEVFQVKQGKSLGLDASV